MPRPLQPRFTFHRRRSGSLSCFSGLIDCTACQQGGSEPAPINSVILNEAVGNLHDLHEVHLIAVRRCARILPNKQSLSVREPSAGSMPPHEVVWPTSRAFCEEGADFTMPSQGPARPPVEDGLHVAYVRIGVWSLYPVPIPCLSSYVL